MAAAAAAASVASFFGVGAGSPQRRVDIPRHWHQAVVMKAIMMGGCRGCAPLIVGGGGRW